VLARDLFLVRFLSILMLFWLPSCAGGLVLLLVRRTAWTVDLLEWAALLSVVALAPLATRLEEFCAPGWVMFAAWMAVPTAGAVGIALLPPAVFVGLCALVGAGIFLWVWLTIPPAFQAAPRKAAAAEPPLPRAEGPISQAIQPSTPAPIWWILACNSYSWWALIGLPGLLWYQQANWLIAGCFLIMMYSQTRMRMRWLDALPFPRRTMLLMALAPAVLPMVIGAAFGQVRGGSVAIHGSTVQVPLELWRSAPGGAAPKVQAPWGETVQPAAVNFLGHPLYNPYGAGPRNSPRFLAWQYQRGKEAAAALPFPPRMRILSAAACLALALLIVWLLELAQWFRLWRISESARSIALILLFAGPVVWELPHFGQTSEPVTAALLRALVRQAAGVLPDNLALATAVAALPVLFLCWLLDRQFRESEQATPFRPRPQ
jgi:hypothetical protein